MQRVKGKDSQSPDVWQALDLHSQQLAHLLHTKADLSNVDHALSARDRPTPASLNQEELDNLKQAVNAKVTKT